MKIINILQYEAQESTGTCCCLYAGTINTCANCPPPCVCGGSEGSLGCNCNATIGCEQNTDCDSQICIETCQALSKPVPFAGIIPGSCPTSPPPPPPAPAAIPDPIPAGRDRARH